MTKMHSFHIPVMGIGFTIDTPLKVSQFGIDSVISIVDDILLEKLRKIYCKKYELPFTEITNNIDDSRAKRITAYLNLINTIAASKFEQLKSLLTHKERDRKEYFDMLPDRSGILQEFKSFMEKSPATEKLYKWLDHNLSMGSIDVNIMTKIDKENYFNGQKLPVEYNDAHAALRGYANSDLNSSVVFSAGMNPKLYSYIKEFEDFYPNEKGIIKKKITLKVSDYRSALIQGKFLAKKGLWVSEYRIESGLNCGGHAFPTDGQLLGSILAEFKDKRNELVETLHEIYVGALSGKDRPIPAATLPVRISAQGGVGTPEEHQFLIDHYQIDSVGWGSPFLLVPETTNVDHLTLSKLIKAKEDDLYLSNISPLGIAFNNLKDNAKDIEKLKLAEQGKPGSPCVKKFLALQKGDDGQTICTASRKYQNAKIKELKKEGVPPQEYQRRFKEIVEKACLCTGLGASAMLVNVMDTRVEGSAVSICPGPNMAYFTKIMSLKQMIGHIYGRANVIEVSGRPNMFVKELNIYINFLKDKIEKSQLSFNQKQKKDLLDLAENLNNGISYLINLFSTLTDKFNDTKSDVLKDLEDDKKNLEILGNV
ncbi:MAG: hypothetical protein K9G58_05535 [Bacteroidales bacterium]|nr:hypothetical protein [Bacteroidales bacterium]MCF8387691.1 hypothetical protein [Bacteroidales bacterium]MCF8397607.1 hypothetical protein [Bacteroidales bacterium]